MNLREMTLLELANELPFACEARDLKVKHGYPWGEKGHGEQVDAIVTELQRRQKLLDAAEGLAAAVRKFRKRDELMGAGKLCQTPAYQESAGALAAYEAAKAWPDMAWIHPELH